jgi:anti-anti-sigma factor
VSRAFAREGARVFLAGRTADKLDRVAEEIRSVGGAAETAQVDALDRSAVEAHADRVVALAGRIDISFNAISYRVVQNTLVEITLDDFMAPVPAVAVGALFRQGRSVARPVVDSAVGGTMAVVIEKMSPRTDRLEGEVDASNVAYVDQVLDTDLASPGDLTLDLSEMTFVDSLGVSLLVAASQKLGGRGNLVLLSPGESVLRVLQLVQLEQRPNVRIG